MKLYKFSVHRESEVIRLILALSAVTVALLLVYTTKVPTQTESAASPVNTTGILGATTSPGAIGLRPLAASSLVNDATQARLDAEQAARDALQDKIDAQNDRADAEAAAQEAAQNAIDQQNEALAAQQEAADAAAEAAAVAAETASTPADTPATSVDDTTANPAIPPTTTETPPTTDTPPVSGTDPTPPVPSVI